MKKACRDIANRKPGSTKQTDEIHCNFPWSNRI